MMRELRLALAVLFLAVVAAGLSLATGAQAQTNSSCNPRPIHRLDQYTSWRYVTPALANEKHIGRCSKIVIGPQQSTLINERGMVVGRS